MRALLFLALLLAGCSPSDPSDLKVIVGARLSPGGGQPEIEYSVVVVEEGTIRAVGPEATTPVPKGGEIINGKGGVISPIGGGTIEVGKPANLEFRDASGFVQRIIRMRAERLER